MDQRNIRNFVIIAHVDHGKSTLADRMLEITGTVPREKMHPQMLDTMDLERERGITIKLQPVRMIYQPSNPKFEYRNECLKAKQIQNANEINSKQVSDFGFRASDLSNSKYTLNLIDTPGHVDFSYEVSRSLAAVEGAVLVVDATKGIQAQTLANLYHAQQNNLAIIPVINKIDLPNAEVEKVTAEISSLLKIDLNKILKVSAKTGEAVAELLKAVIEKIPPPAGKVARPFKALIFDSVYDAYRGVIAYVRVFEGQVKRGEKIKFLVSKKIETVAEVGEFKLGYQPKETLEVGEIGYIMTGAKDLKEVQVGDTISWDSPSEVSPIPGFKIPQPMVFASFYVQGDDSNLLRQALEKLKLNDSSLIFKPENSQTFGYGFRLGFLGLLHLEIAKVRLEREYNLDLIVTQPSVLYHQYHQKEVGGHITYDEPWVKLEIITPPEYLGPVMELVQSKRGIYKNTHYIGGRPACNALRSNAGRAVLDYEAPLAEIIIDFYDKLKSVSSGYASQNYELIDWRIGDLAKLDVIIANEKVEEFSRIIPRFRAQSEAKNLALKLKNLIPRQMFEVSIQVASNNKILARENISAMKKDVTAKLYGGDVTRKNKLLKKQVKGKKKMKQMGKVSIPSDVFMEILKE